MKIYRFLKTIPYGATHPHSLPIDRRILFVCPEGMENPECPCVVINGMEVMLPDHEIWSLGGTMPQWQHAEQLRTTLPYYGNGLIGKVECFLIWRNHHGLNPNSII